jgi:hypothetical protein
LQHFGKIGTGDVLLLAQEVEKEKEKALHGEVTNPENRDERGASPMVGPAVANSALAGDSKGDSFVEVEVPAAVTEEVAVEPTPTEPKGEAPPTEGQEDEGDVKMQS